MSNTTRGPPIAPVTGIPANTKQAGQRVDFRAKQFELLIATKGYRIAWSRSCMCPCKPINTQTTQPNPNCSLCGGRGRLYFRPENYQVPDDIGELDDQQLALLDREHAVAIRAIITSVARNMEDYDRIGPWLFGTINVTVRPENRLGYEDRITHLDSVMALSEVKALEDIEGVPLDPTANLSVHYPIVDVNLCINQDGRRFTQGTDFCLTEHGEISWFTGRAPNSGDRMGLHYHCRPTWLVWEHPNLVRETSLKFKEDSEANPLGRARFHPIKAIARLEYVVDQETPEV